tara:strand:- start:171 stop:425 length:255 start_codon:yes stop_codon:yes gene_type:complete
MNNTQCLKIEHWVLFVGEVIKMIKLDSIVRLKIKGEEWTGKVVEIRGNTTLIQLSDNMHYHAKLEELELFTPTAQVLKPDTIIQ